MSIRLEARNRGNIRLDMDNASLAAKYAREAGAAEKAAELSAANAAGAAERADAAAEAALRAEAGAQSAAVHLPQPGENGTWLVWDQAGDSYVDSGENCTGVQGERGLKGDTGDKGDKGDTGSKGDDGVSPTVTVTDITGGHRVTITDANHPQGQPFDVMDGEVAQEDFDELSGDVDDLKSAFKNSFVKELNGDVVRAKWLISGGNVTFNAGVTNTIAINKMIMLDYDIVIDANEGYMFLAFIMSAPTNLVTDIGIYTNFVTHLEVPKNTPFYFEIRNTSQTSITADKFEIAITTKKSDTELNKEVDLIVFAGQSNMAGRGVSNATWPETAPEIIPGAGYEYRAASQNPPYLVNIAEPFGINENNPDGINDGTQKTGSMVTAFVNAYYTHNGGVPVIGVSASKGGSAISEWQPSTPYLTDAINRLDLAKTWLAQHNFSVRNIFLAWCQGEHEAGTAAQDDDNNYITDFQAMFSVFKAHGVTKCLLVRIGEINSGDESAIVIQKQTEMAQTDPDIVMVTTDLASFRERGLMKDNYHFYQAAYNEAGTYAGTNAANYVVSGKEPTMYDPKYRNLYYSHDGLEGQNEDPVDGLATKAPVIIDTASGAIASFEDGADNMPLKSLMVNVEPVQDLHGYDSPWPAGGGANICDEVFESGTINSNGNNAGDDTRIRTKNYIPCRPNTSYFYKGPSVLGMRYYDESKVHLGSSYNAAIQADAVFTTPAGAYYLRFSVANTTEYANNIAINYPSSVTAYAPYSNVCLISGWTGCNISHSGANTSDPTVIPITFPASAGTVYGGMLDVTSGELTVARAIVDVGELSIAGFSPETHVATYTINDRAYGVGIRLDSISNTYAFYGYGTADNLINNLADAQYGFQTSSRAVRIRDDRFSTAEDFVAAMSGVKIVYYLSSEQTYQLTAQQVITLLGTNNIWADCGPVSVDYPADTKLYIDALTAPTEDDMIANARIESGKYFMVGNTLYLSTALILAGETINPGTNCTKTNIAAALNALNT